MIKVRWMATLVVFVLLSMIVAQAEAQDKPFEGVEINILTFVGPQVAEPLQRRGPDFTELTGAKVNVVTSPTVNCTRKL
jgi:multiple sugar transport system substrate-binding protein